MRVLYFVRTPGVGPVRPRPYTRPCILLLVAVALGCGDLPLTAPEGSRIDLSAGPTTIAAGGDTARVTAIVTEADGLLVENGTAVLFTLSSGLGCALEAAAGGTSDPASCTWLPAVTAKTRNGLAYILVESGSAGTLTVTARSGNISATRDLAVSSRLAPNDAKALLQAEDDTVAVNSPVTLTAFFTQSTGAPVTDGTRVVFSSNAGIIAKKIVVTRDGFADTSIRGSQPGDLDIVVTSGVVRATAKVVVQ